MSRFVSRNGVSSSAFFLSPVLGILGNAEQMESNLFSASVLNREDFGTKSQYRDVVHMHVLET